MSICNAARFKQLVKNSGLSQSKAADLIAAKLGRFYSERDIRSWQVEAGGKNCRPCPANVLEMFEQEFGENKKAA